MMGVSIITGVKTSAAMDSGISIIIGIITGVKTSAAMGSEILTITGITIEIIIGTITEMTASAATMVSAVTASEILTITEMTVSAATITATMVSAATASEISIITEMTASAVTASVRAIDPDRDLMAGATIKADLAIRVLRAALCQKARLKMPRSIETRKSAASVRRRISGTAKI